MKKIVYVATDNGVDGRGKSRVKLASFDESELKQQYDVDKNKNWLTRGEKIIDVSFVRTQAIKKLDAIERLVLGL